jgi:hypothetical protein
MVRSKRRARRLDAVIPALKRAASFPEVVEDGSTGLIVELPSRAVADGSPPGGPTAWAFATLMLPRIPRTSTTPILQVPLISAYRSVVGSDGDRGPELPPYATRALPLQFIILPAAASTRSKLPGPREFVGS